MLISHPETEDEIEVDVWFYFYKGYSARGLYPTEPPSVDVLSVLHGDIDIINNLSNYQFKHIESVLLESVISEVCY
jgi:hypothetical protein